MVRRTKLAVVSIAALLVAGSCDSARAATVDGLAAAVRSARQTDARLARSAPDYRAETALADRVDRLADDFHDLSAQGASLVLTASELINLMKSIHGRHDAVLQRLQAEVIRIDGDLEAAQDSEEWRQHELIAMRVLYRLNWVLYETAMRFETDTAQRKRLLQEAARGFADFMGSGDASLTVEVLLGHGLASKALKSYQTTIDDLTAALEIAEDREMIARLRIALTETYFAIGREADALTESAKLLQAGPRGEPRKQALFLRSKALLSAISSGRAGGSAARYRRESAEHLEHLYGSGTYWRAKVVQLVDAGIVDPEAWVGVSGSDFVLWLVADSLQRRDRCDRATAFYERLLPIDRFHGEALYGLGSCAFDAGRYQTAVDRLSEFLEGADADATERPQALYLRFKAAESLYVSADANELEAAGGQYIALLRAFLENAADHERAYEAWFRLGEWQRDHAQYVECGEAFANVDGDNVLALKAAYLSGQCYVEAVVAYTDDEPPADLVRRTVSSLDAFLAAVDERSKSEAAEVIRPLQARAVVMAASVVTRAPPGTMRERLQRLDGFEQRFGEGSELLAEVLSLRIVAYRSLGDLDGAGAQLERLLALEGAEAYRSESLKKLGIVFLKEAAEREERGDSEGAARSRRVALRVYERLLMDLRSQEPETVEAGALAGVEQLVAGLREQVRGAAGEPAAP